MSPLNRKTSWWGYYLQIARDGSGIEIAGGVVSWVFICEFTKSWKTKMSEQKYNEVFEFIKSNLIPKIQFDESQNEILVLKSALDNATNDIEKLKLEFQEQTMTIDFIKAERESLIAEQKAFEVKFNEVSLKLKQKTYQYDSLLKMIAARLKLQTLWRL